MAIKIAFKDAEKKSDLIAQLIVYLGRLTFLGRGRLRRALLSSLERRGILSLKTTYRGVSYCFHLDNPTERRAIFGKYNNEEIDFLLKYVIASESVFVDIGANSGFFTNYMLAKAGSLSTILAVEPNPKMVGRILANAELLNKCLSKKLIVETCALSDVEETGYLDLTQGVGSAHLIREPTNSAMQIQVTTLQSLLIKHSIQKIDALKIDVEGHEDRALYNFIETAPRDRLPRAIVIEHTSSGKWRSDLFALLRTLDYRVVMKTRGNFLMRKT
jgi:FkbM family methyltransferase